MGNVILMRATDEGDTMRPSYILTSAAIVLAAIGVSAESQAPAAATQLTYADLVDLALAPPVAVHIEVPDAARPRNDRATGVEAGGDRSYPALGKARCRGEVGES